MTPQNASVVRIGSRPDRPTRNAGSDEAFDVWLGRGLHALYDDVAQQPIPPALLALLHADRKGRLDRGGDGDRG